MNSNRFLIVSAIIVTCLLFMGCTKPYNVLIELEQPLKPVSRCCIGEIEDMLPLDMAEEDKPSLEEITKFRNYIAEQLVKRDIFGFAFTEEQNCDYEVVGSLVEFQKGSGALRFLIGFGAGNAKMTTSLGLIDKSNDRTVFSASFSRSVSSGLESSSAMYKNIAKDFAKVLSKQMKKLK